MVVLLLIANTINIGADLGAMADATALVTGAAGGDLPAVCSPIFCAAAEGHSATTRTMSRILKWLTLALFTYVVTLFLVHIPWARGARAAWSFPKSTECGRDLIMIVAILGTTISPYLFFWQASQEAEEVDAILTTASR